MNKTQKIKTATSKARDQQYDLLLEKIILFPWRLLKAIWRLICRICRKIWEWLKSIDVVGMVNLTLLIVIIVLFSILIANFVCCNKRSGCVNQENRTFVSSVNQNENRKVVKRGMKTTLSGKTQKQTVASVVSGRDKLNVKTDGFEDGKNVAVSKDEAKVQVLSGDVIVDVTPSSPVLADGVKINGNLFIQNMRKYTLPCGTKINGHLFVRNVDKLHFCGAFTVNGNIYVNRQSSFGPLPSGARVRGQIIL